MSVTKLDLYKTEWLDLVFANKNKQYGAYYLRQHYASYMLRALGITFFAIGGAIAIYSIITSNIAPPEIRYDDSHVVTLVEPPKLIEPEKPLDPIKAETPKPAAAKPAAATAITVIPVTVTEDEHKAIEPTKTEDLAGVTIGNEIKEGAKSNDNVDPGTNTTGGGTGTGTGTGTDETIHGLGGLTEMPEPVGGAEAWSKFLQRNLRYPPMAEEQGVSGRVLLSFIIEKDGSLSNITVDRKAGFGFDEEALRVLKKAAAWKPGMQNGRPVRVKYSIPINFRLPE